MKSVRLACFTLIGALYLSACANVTQPDVSPAPDAALSARPYIPSVSEEPKTQVGFFFDTVITMRVYTDNDALLDEALEACQYYDALLSKTSEVSDVWKLNHAGGSRVSVSDETREILEKAIDYSRLSDGAFDVTVEPCVALWDLSAQPPVLPDAAALAQAAEKVDWTQIDLDEDGVMLPDGVTIDLGAIAKGYITDKIAQLLRRGGVTSGYLNFGGNVYVIGAKPDGSPWNIGIQDPKGVQQQSIVGAVPITDKAVVTSGIYERGFDLDGVRYHHILDPATGWPTQNELAGVTIVTDNAFDADALSTTLFTLGTERGMALAQSLPGVEAVFIDRDNNVSYTPGLEGVFIPM